MIDACLFVVFAVLFLVIGFWIAREIYKPRRNFNRFELPPKHQIK